MMQLPAIRRILPLPLHVISIYFISLLLINPILDTAALSASKVSKVSLNVPSGSASNVSSLAKTN